MITYFDGQQFPSEKQLDESKFSYFHTETIFPTDYQLEHSRFFDPTKPDSFTEFLKWFLVFVVVASVVILVVIEIKKK